MSDLSSTLVIAGTGAAGVACALTAAKLKTRVVLLEKSGQLGGTVTKALIHTLGGFFNDQVHWKTIERLPLDEPLQGAFLQTLHGKKYPALRQIASRLLASGEHVCLKQQTASFYWYGDVEPSPLEWVKTTQAQAQKQAVMETFLSQQQLPPLPIRRMTPATKPTTRKPKEKKSGLSRNNYQKPLENSAHEALALQLYETLNQMGGSEFQKLSQATARQLVVAYDERLLCITLDTLKKRLTTGSIRNPVGFYITLIRSGKRAIHHNHTRTEIESYTL